MEGQYLVGADVTDSITARGVSTGKSVSTILIAELKGRALITEEPLRQRNSVTAISVGTDRDVLNVC